MEAAAKARVFSASLSFVRTWPPGQVAVTGAQLWNVNIDIRTEKFVSYTDDHINQKEKKKKGGKEERKSLVPLSNR